MSRKSDDTLILDVRPEAAFETCHRLGAVNIPLESLAIRIHELPPREQRLTVFDICRTRASWACSRLRARGRSRIDVVHGESWLAGGPTACGPSYDRLWEPHKLLIEGAETARRLWGTVEGRTALDIACGSGRDAVFLALSGFSVTGWDVLPDALDRCRETARRCGTSVRTECRNVEREAAIDGSQYDLICCFNFLHRPLLPSILGGVREGGLVVYETFVHPQREMFGKPRKDAHLLKPGELRGYFAGWDLLTYHEGLAGPRRHVASLIARKPTRRTDGVCRRPSLQQDTVS